MTRSESEPGNRDVLDLSIDKITCILVFLGVLMAIQIYANTKTHAGNNEETLVITNNTGKPEIIVDNKKVFSQEQVDSLEQQLRTFKQVSNIKVDSNNSAIVFAFSSYELEGSGRWFYPEDVFYAELLVQSVEFNARLFPKRDTPVSVTNHYVSYYVVGGKQFWVKEYTFTPDHTEDVKIR